MSGCMNLIEMASKVLERDGFLIWLFLGDSITEANHCSEGYPGYVSHIETRLTSLRGKRKFAVVNAAAGGSCLTTEFERQEMLVDRLNPNFVTAMFGMNDCVRGAETAGEFERAIARLSKACAAKSAELVWLTQNPIDFNCPLPPISSRTAHPLFQKAALSTCASIGIPSFDIYGEWEREVLAKSGNEHFKMLHDAIHPNHKGHEFIFQILSKAGASKEA